MLCIVHMTLELNLRIVRIEIQPNQAESINYAQNSAIAGHFRRKTASDNCYPNIGGRS